VNLNPFTSFGTLTLAQFAFSLIALMTLNMVAARVFEKFIFSARTGGRFSQLFWCYGAWVLWTSIAFFAISGVFIKRWAVISGASEKDAPLSRLARSAIRLSLLCPVIPIFTSLLTLAFSLGEGFKRLARWQQVLTIGAALIALHGGFIGVRLVRGEIQANEIFSRQESVRDRVHFDPYLNPSARYARDLLAGYKMVMEGGEPAPEDASPLLAMLREIQVQESSVVGGVDSLAPVEASLARMERLIAPLEKARQKKQSNERPSYLNGSEVLRWFASPEIPILAFGDEMQIFILGKKLGVNLEPQLSEIAAALAAPEVSQNATVPIGELNELNKKLSSLRSRIRALNP
jgi:hypothetical protein